MAKLKIGLAIFGLLDVVENTGLLYFLYAMQRAADACNQAGDACWLPGELILGAMLIIGLNIVAVATCYFRYRETDTWTRRLLRTLIVMSVSPLSAFAFWHGALRILHLSYWFSSLGLLIGIVLPYICQVFVKIRVESVRGIALK